MVDDATKTTTRVLTAISDILTAQTSRQVKFRLDIRHEKNDYGFHDEVEMHMFI